MVTSVVFSQQFLETAKYFISSFNIQRTTSTAAAQHISNRKQQESTQMTYNAIPKIPICLQMLRKSLTSNFIYLYLLASRWKTGISDTPTFPKRW